LVVGTERIKSSIRARSGSVTVIEPPVDTAANKPSADGAAAFRRQYPGLRGALRVVVVSRLVVEMKLEGILTLIKVTRLMAEQARGPLIHLTIVGDGPAMGDVRAAAELANRAAARMRGGDIVTLTGEISDPRPAYAAADIAVGMGGSALRSLAFGKPLIVQGEGGFFEVLDPATLPRFLEQGFFGQAHLEPAEAGARLRSLLHGLAQDDARREQLGSWGRELVQTRFSLAAAAERQADVYRRALLSPMSRRCWLGGGFRAAPGLVRHQVSRRLDRLRDKEVRDDFNARPA
jgi:glycosyltransferase involved in cell wall biosynthesis